MTAPDNNQDVRARIHGWNEDLRPMFENSVIPILGEQDEGLVQCGTGTLLAVADARFLVTAAHVTEWATEFEVTLYISSGLRDDFCVALHGEVAHTDDPHDIAIWKLQPDTVAALDGRVFLNHSRIDLSPLPPKNGWFQVFGYPTVWSDVRHEEEATVCQAFSYGARLYTETAEKLIGCDPSIHLLLKVFTQKTVDSTGAPASLPDNLEGISGCSLWQVYREGRDPAQWTKDDARILAVQTQIYSDTDQIIVRGTTWRTVIEMLKRNYPELRKPLQIHLP